MLAPPGQTCDAACQEWEYEKGSGIGGGLNMGGCHQNRMNTVGHSSTLFDEVMHTIGCQVFQDSQDYAPSFWPYSPSGCYCSRRKEGLSFPNSCEAHSPVSDRRFCCCEAITTEIYNNPPDDSSPANMECPDPIQENGITTVKIRAVVTRMRGSCFTIRPRKRIIQLPRTRRLASREFARLQLRQ